MLDSGYLSLDSDSTHSDQHRSLERWGQPQMMPTVARILEKHSVLMHVL